MNKATIRLIFALTLPALLAAAACNHPSEVHPATPETVRGVRVAAVAVQKLAQTSEAVGTVRANESATLSAQVMGTVSAVNVREGDHVRAGQVLLTIDAAQMTSQAESAKAGVAAAGQQLAAAESDSALASGTLQRYEMLKAQKSVSPQEFTEVESRAKAAAARVAALRAQHDQALAASSAAATMQSYTRIRAPFDGLVVERRVDPGAMAAPGVPLITLEKSGVLRLEASVDESLIATVREGMTLSVVLPALGDAHVDGRVARILPAADAASHSFLVKIDLPASAQLRSGMYGRALLPRAGEREVLLLPRSAVVAHGSMQSVYVVGADHLAAVRYITTGNASGDNVEALSGLSAGELVVLSAEGRELGGKRIEVQP